MKQPKKNIRNTRQRREYILAHLAEHSSITVESIAHHFAVSTVTARADLRLLEAKGELVRHYGGAMLSKPIAAVHIADDRLSINMDIKHKLGKAAAELVQPGESIILDSGTTTKCIAQQLSGISPLHVMTNSLPVLLELSAFKGITSMVTGGHLCHKSQSFCGAQAENNLKEFHFDKLFLGVDGFHLDKGISTYNDDEARVNSIMAEVAEEVIVVTDSSKFKKLSLYKIINLDKIDVLITDSNIPENYRLGVLECGIELVIVD
ncbi:MAG: transcriptional repressor AgaR [Oceanospirillaceae bacterium]